MAYALSFGGSLLLSWAAQHFAPQLDQPNFRASGVPALLLLVVFAPLVETLIMAGVLTLLLGLMPAAAAILVSAALWGVAHSLQAPAWGLVIWWPFLIFSTLYVVWRQRGAIVGIAVVAATHALQNLGPALFVADIV